MSNWPSNRSIHSLGAWCGEWVAAGGEIEEEWPSRIDDLHLLHPGDRPVREVGGKMIVGIARARHAVAVLVKDRLVLARVAGVEAVEVIEAEAIRPAVERADLARLPDRRVVVLADPGGGVAVLP
jgi:hypothetical protein